MEICRVNFDLFSLESLGVQQITVEMFENILDVWA